MGAAGGAGARVAGALLLACTALLAVVGRYTVAGAGLPVVLVNLIGGHGLLALLAWLWVQPKTDAAALLPAGLLVLLAVLGACVNQFGQQAAAGLLNTHTALGVLTLAWAVLTAWRQGGSASHALRMLILFLAGAAVVGVLMRASSTGLALAVLHSLLAALSLAAAVLLSRRD